MDDKQLNNTTNGQSSSEQIIEEEDETITMLDVLQEEQDLEDDAFAVLAGSDDQNCTYLKGYLSRQALYACNTCQLIGTSDDQLGSYAAICLACSYRCHDGHDLIELYTKRNFRCDCGNNKFVDNNCKLYSKSSLNVENKYNHNFDGLYCSCLRPYPDPDSDVDDSMIQCVVCEDWFHGRHLENFPENQEFAEMICKSCTNRLPFLWFYHKSYDEKKGETDDKIDVSSNQPKESLKEQTVCESDSGVETSCDSIDSSSKSNDCKLQTLKNTITERPPEELSSTYWPLEWRQNLCKCRTCLETYTKNKCLFLTDEKDMVHYYETQSRESNTKVSHYDKGLSELNKMNRIQQIEYINGYNDLKNSLEEYLRKFAENKKTVREEDIKEFFEQMSSRKRQKVNIPFNCK